MEWILFYKDPEFKLSLAKLNDFKLQWIAAIFYEIKFCSALSANNFFEKGHLKLNMFVIFCIKKSLCLE